MGFRIARVRFSDGGQVYAVNCARAFRCSDGSVRIVREGDRLIVLMNDDLRQLKQAMVIATGSVRSRCNHTALCFPQMLNEFSDYGPGSVDTADMLARYLMKNDWYSLLFTDLHDWPIALRRVTPDYGGTCIFLNALGAGKDDGSGLGLSVTQKGVLEVSSGVTVSRFEGEAEDSFRKAAEWACVAGRIESCWIEDDNTSEIRGAISSDGGSAYLGDDVWL